MAEEPAKPKGRGRKPKPAAASLSDWALALEQDRERVGGAGRRGALGPPSTSMCAALFCCPFSGGALIPLLRPLLRQMVHLGKRQAWKPIRGDSLWNWPPPFNVGLKVWRSRASACSGAVKPPSTGRPTEGEADTRFLAAPCVIANTRWERLPGDIPSVPG